jgi:hypothetical protein
LITAAGEIVVGAVGMPILFDGLLFGALVLRFTIFGAPRTTVRPSSSSSIAANFAERLAGAGGTVPGRDDGVAGVPAAGRTDGRDGIASPSAFVGINVVISSSLIDANLPRPAAGGGTLRFDVGGTEAGDAMSSLVTTSLSPDSSRPGRFVKGSMILRSLVRLPLANRKPAPGHCS